MIVIYFNQNETSKEAIRYAPEPTNVVDQYVDDGFDVFGPREIQKSIIVSREEVA